MQCEPVPAANFTITSKDDMILSIPNDKKKDSLMGWYVVTAKEADSIRDDPV